MSPYNLLCLRISAGLLYPADVERAVLPLEAAHAAHVVAVVGELVAAEAVDVWVEDVMDRREAVEVFAVLTFGAWVVG